MSMEKIGVALVHGKTIPLYVRDCDAENFDPVLIKELAEAMKGGVNGVCNHQSGCVGKGL